MAIFKIMGSSMDSKIIIGEKLSRLSHYLGERRTVVITDSHVRGLYEEDFPSSDVIELQPGERFKNLESVGICYRRLLELEADRSVFICGIGGGVVCDVTGFVASTFMRGVDFGFAASTLLAQVDAAVGGKNGIDFDGFKNMVGTFRQPVFVLSDIRLLNTLPPREIACGLAEVVKTAAIGSRAFFEQLEARVPALLALEPTWLEDVVTECVRIKTAVVKQDEKELGLRRILNFGHTLAHALEKTSGISHGRAVSLGMVFAVEFSVRKRRLPQKEADRIIRLLDRMRLPVDLHEKGGMLRGAIRKDKKRSGNEIKFVFLEGIGMPAVESVRLSELESVIEDLC